MGRTRLMLPSLVLVARKLQLVTAVLVVAFILTEKTVCRPKFGVVKLTGEGTKLEGGEHLAPEIRIMSPKEVDRLRNHYIRYEDDEDIPRKGHGFAQQLRSNIVTLDDFRKEMVSDSAMKDRDAFATALGSGKRSDNHYFLADLLHNFYLWRKVKGLEAWDESIVLRVKQDLGKRRPEDVMLGDFLDAIFHRDHDHSVSEERFLRWLSRRHFVAEGDEVLLNSKRDKEFYNLEDLIQNYILWARNEDENRIPNGPWIIATLGEPGEKVAGKMMEFVRIKGLLKYRWIPSYMFELPIQIKFPKLTTS